MMLQHSATPLTRPWQSIRFASRLGQGPTDVRRSFVKTTATTSNPVSAENVHRPTSILSRLSDRPHPRTRRESDTEHKSPDTRVRAAVHGTPHPRATSFVSARSAQKRDHAAGKWFKDVQQLDISNVDQRDDLKSVPRRKRTGSELRRQHEMRPRTDLNTLFTLPAARSATSLRVQAEKELGGDYTSYLPDGHTDPHRLPIAYARLVLGRNKHIPLNAQIGALDIIEEAIQGKMTRQVV